MQESSIAMLVLLGLTLAVQPWSVLASVLLLTSRRGIPKTIAFVAGWVLALLAVALVAVAVGPRQSSSSTASGHYALELLLGLLLLLWLAVRWRRRRGRASKPPSWMARIDGMTSWAALALGGFLPNYLIVVAAVNELLLANVDGGQLALVLTAFIVVASSGVAAPLVVIVDRKRGDERLARWRWWLDAHSSDVLYGVGLLLAVLLSVKGAVGLLG